jgi:hypothetical protein
MPSRRAASIVEQSLPADSAEDLAGGLVSIMRNSAGIAGDIASFRQMAKTFLVIIAA